MLETTTTYDNAIISPIRELYAKVIVYEDEEEIETFSKFDNLKSIEISRVGEHAKFFGFGIAQRLNLHLIDIDREIDYLSTANQLVVSIGVKNINSVVEYMDFPTFYITEINRNENTNELSITAYDNILQFDKHTVGELNSSGYTIGEFIEACGQLYGLDVVGTDEEQFDVEYPEGANFNGDETIRQALIMAAEATQTIFYINANNELVFKSLNTESVYHISKSEYITLTSGDNRRLQTVCSATELGDNVSSSTSLIGSTQYCRENAFYTMRDDIGDLLDDAISRVGNMTIRGFQLDFRGNPALECGDRISVEDKDLGLIYTNVIDDTITYDGSLKEVMKWDYTESEETFSNPSTIGEKLRQTFARVDKQNQQILILADNETNTQTKFSELYIDTNEIRASVSSLSNNTDASINSLQEQIDELQTSVSQTITPEQLQIAIETVKTNGVNSITTTTGFKFNDQGITISKTDAPTETNINENGMIIRANDTDVLTVKNTGVEALNLTAHKYLIIGQYSRIEDYGNRTGVFWIGG